MYNWDSILTMVPWTQYKGAVVHQMSFFFPIEWSKGSYPSGDWPSGPVVYYSRGLFFGPSHTIPRFLSFSGYAVPSTNCLIFIHSINSDMSEGNQRREEEYRRRQSALLPQFPTWNYRRRDWKTERTSISFVLRAILCPSQVFFYLSTIPSTKIPRTRTSRV